MRAGRAPPRRSRSSDVMLENCCFAAAACVLTVCRRDSSSERSAAICASLGDRPSLALLPLPLPPAAALVVAPGSPLVREEGSSTAGGGWWSLKAAVWPLRWRRLQDPLGCRLAGQLPAAAALPSRVCCGSAPRCRLLHLTAGPRAAEAATLWAAWAANPIREIIRDPHPQSRRLARAPCTEMFVLALNVCKVAQELLQADR